MDFEEKLDKRVKELEEKLKKASENMRKAKENGNDEQYARESSNHTKLTEEIRSLQKTKEAFEKINRQIKDKQKQLNSISNRMKNARKDGKNDEYDKLKAEYDKVHKEIKELVNERQNKLINENREIFGGIDEKKSIDKDKKDGESKKSSDKDKKDGESKKSSDKDKKDGESKESSDKDKKDGESKKSSDKDKKDGESKKSSDKDKKDGESKKSSDKDKKDGESKESSDKDKKDGESKKSSDKDKKDEEYERSLIERYAELINQGYDVDSPELIEFYKEIAKERKIKIEQEKGIRNENGDLKYPIVPVNNEKTTDDDKKYEIVPIDENIPESDKTENSENKKDKRLEIVYDGKNNQYILKNYKDENLVFYTEEEKKKYFETLDRVYSKPVAGKKFKSKKKKIRYIEGSFKNDKENLKEILGDKKLKDIAKYCDPQLLVMLANINVIYAKQYVRELSKGKDDKKEPVEYSMKYNLKDMRKNHKRTRLSLLQRMRINKMAKKNHEKGVAEYIPDDKSRKWLIFPIVGALAAGGIALANNQKNDEKQVQPKQEYTDTTNPGGNLEKTTGQTTTEHTSERTTTTTKTANKPSVQDVPSTLDKSVVDTSGNDRKNENQGLVLGSKVSMPAGVTYTQDSLENGAKGVIGELSYRPEGEYVIDRVALWYDGKLQANLGTAGTDVNQEIEKIAKKLGVNPSEIVQKAHICLGENHDAPTGWIKADEFSMDDIKANISKTYDQIQQEKVAKQTQTQKNTQQQDHEDR